MTREETSSTSSRHAWLWPGLVVLMLGGQLVFSLVAVSLATRDPSFAVENDYYERAVHWDSLAAAWRAVEEAGWVIAPVLEADADVLGNRTLTVTIHDTDHQPIIVADITGELFQHANASRRTALQFTPLGDGRYQARVRMEQTGWWQLRLTMHRADTTYAFDQAYVLRTLQGGVAW